jgi:uncharacterized protein (TIGR03435 family)
MRESLKFDMRQQEVNRMVRQVRRIAIAALMFPVSGVFAQPPTPRPRFDAFEVATIKPVGSDAKSGQYITMQGTNRFIEKAYTLKLMIAAAYSLNPRTISGGPGWIESDRYDIVAVTPGEVRPTHEEQMSMLQALLGDRFKLTFHREPKEFSIYALEVARGGPKLKQSAAGPGEPVVVGPGVLSEGSPRVRLPVRNATLADFATLMQRAILDRPVVDRTGLTDRYDFDLEWAADETQFGGGVPTAPPDAASAPLFTAIQEQLGLKFVATKGQVEALVVDSAERPSAN